MTSKITAMPSDYKQLYSDHHIPTSTQSIRLLRIEKCVYAEDDRNGLPIQLKGSFEVHDLDTVPEFRALSYCWGHESTVTGVLSIKGHDCPVRTNLRDALVHIWDRKGRQRDDEHTWTSNDTQVTHTSTSDEQGRYEHNPHKRPYGHRRAEVGNQTTE